MSGVTLPHVHYGPFVCNLEFSCGTRTARLRCVLKTEYREATQETLVFGIFWSCHEQVSWQQQLYLASWIIQEVWCHCCCQEFCQFWNFDFVLMLYDEFLRMSHQPFGNVGKPRFPCQRVVSRAGRATYRAFQPPQKIQCFRCKPAEHDGKHRN